MLQLTDPLTLLKGIGPSKAAALKKAGLESLADLLRYYPRAYQDRRTLTPIADLTPGENKLIQGRISQMAFTGFGKKRTLRLLLTDSSGSLEVLFFNATYLARSLSRDSNYQFFGRVSRRGGRLRMLHPDVQNANASGQGQGWLPVYPLVHGITQKNLYNWIDQVLPLSDDLTDHLPAQLVQKNRLIGLAQALRAMHRPSDRQTWREARFRLIFDEFLLLFLGIMLRSRQSEAVGQAIVLPPGREIDEFLSRLPFSPTDAQRRVLSEIEADMTSPKVMDRLIQGDVGSGKTMVAAAAAYKSIRNGYQAVLMAPTEVLARQHAKTITGWFSSLKVSSALLTGRISSKARQELLQDLSQGRIDFLVGTHALLQADVCFHSLGLVITDEQHRFGVRQRELLVQKSKYPDRLVMTATPIPKTLAATLYSELELSAIDELPPGRKPVLTRIARQNERRSVYEFMRQEVAKGGQAYIVTPLIEESDKLDAKAASQLFAGLTAFFPDIKAGLLHGALPSVEKDRVMQEFAEGRLSVLVSTVVIEVGVNVQNATVMIIESADRFGLATLHQLRGRVGRGDRQSHCILISDAREGVAAERAAIMTQTNDGFLIAEKDLELRGPGEFFGTRQHGLPELKLADPVRHFKIMVQAQTLARELMQRDPELKLPEHRLLKANTEKLFTESGR